MVDVVPTQHILKFGGGGTPGVYPLPGSQILGSQIGVDLENAIVSVRNINTGIYTNRRCRFLDDEYVIHGDENSVTGGIFKRGADTWLRVHTPAGVNSLMDVASGLHITHPLGVPTLSILYWEINSGAGGDVRWARTTNGTSWTDTEISLFTGPAVPTQTGQALVWRKSIVWVTSEILEGATGRGTHVFDTELETISHLNAMGASASTSAAERALHIHKGKLYVLGYVGLGHYVIRRRTSTFVEIHNEAASHFAHTNTHGHGCMFTDPTSGDLVAILSGGSGGTFPATTATSKVLSFPNADTDASPATVVNRSATVMGATHGADKYLTGGAAANFERRWTVIVDNQTAPGTSRVFLVTSTGPAGGTTETWQWMGLAAEMEPIGGLVGVANTSYALTQTLQGGGERYTSSGHVALEGIPSREIAGTRFQFRGRKAATGTVSFRASDLEDVASVLVPIVAGSLTVGSGFDTNLEAYYKFNSSFVDSSGNGLTLTQVGSIPFVAGLFGNGADFPGVDTNYLHRTTNDTALDFTGIVPFTISAWVDFDTLPGAPAGYVVSKTSGTGGWQLIVGTDGSLTFGSHAVFVGPTTPGDVSIAAGMQHLLVTSDGATLTLYIDAATVGTGAAMSITATTNTLRLGNRFLNDGACDAVFDEVAIWSRGFTPAEVTALYNAGTGKEIDGSPTALPTTPSINVNAIDNFTCDNGATLYSVKLDVASVGITEGFPGTMIAILV